TGAPRGRAACRRVAGAVAIEWTGPAWIRLPDAARPRRYRATPDPLLSILPRASSPGCRRLAHWCSDPGHPWEDAHARRRPPETPCPRDTGPQAARSFDNRTPTIRTGP